MIIKDIKNKTIRKNFSILKSLKNKILKRKSSVNSTRDYERNAYPLK